MSLFQAAAVLFALLMMYVVGVHQKKRVFTAFESSLWYTMWILFITFSLFPDTLVDIVEILHFNRVFDLLTVMAFIVLTVLVMASYIKQRQAEMKIEQLVRSLAIKTQVASTNARPKRASKTKKKR